MTRWLCAVIATLTCGLLGCGSGGTAAPAPNGVPAVTGVTPNGVAGPTGSQVRFTATNTGVVTGWAWDFGTGAVPQTSTEAEPIVTLASSGVYTGTVTVHNNAGTAQPFTFHWTTSDIVGAVPEVLQVTPPPGTVLPTGTPVTFSAIASATPTAWHWSFGANVSPATSVEVTPTVTPIADGPITGTVVASNANGDSEPFAITLSALSLPQIDAVEPPAPVTGVHFYSLFFDVQTSGGAVDDYVWDFAGAGTPSTSALKSPGIWLTGSASIWPCTVAARNAAGTSAPYAFNLEVLPSAPELSSLSPTFGDRRGAAGESVTFHVIASSPPPWYASWDFGGGAIPNTADGPYATITLGEPGSYTGEVRLYNRGGERREPFHYRVVGRGDPPGWQYSPITEVESSGLRSGQLAIIDGNPAILMLTGDHPTGYAVLYQALVPNPADGNFWRRTNFGDANRAILRQGPDGPFIFLGAYNEHYNIDEWAVAKTYGPDHDWQTRWLALDPAIGALNEATVNASDISILTRVGSGGMSWSTAPLGSWENDGAFVTHQVAPPADSDNFETVLTTLAGRPAIGYVTKTAQFQHQLSVAYANVPSPTQSSDWVLSNSGPLQSLVIDPGSDIAIARFYAASDAQRLYIAYHADVNQGQGGAEFRVATFTAPAGWSDTLETQVSGDYVLQGLSLTGGHLHLIGTRKEGGTIVGRSSASLPALGPLAYSWAQVPYRSNSYPLESWVSATELDNRLLLVGTQGRTLTLATAQSDW